MTVNRKELEAVLASKHCVKPGCNCAWSPDKEYEFRAACHAEVTPRVVYYKGVLYVICGECQQLVVAVDVGPAPEIETSSLSGVLQSLKDPD